MKLFELTNENKKFQSLKENIRRCDDDILAIVETCISEKCTTDELVESCAISIIDQQGGPKTLDEHILYATSKRKLNEWS